MNLNIFNNKQICNNLSKEKDDLINTFIGELKNALKNIMNEGTDMNHKNNIPEENNILEEYNLYEKKKIFLDNKSWKGNDLAWVIDDKSVCLSEHGDGGPYFISEIDLPKDVKVGEVYEKIDGQYIYNETITKELNEIVR